MKSVAFAFTGWHVQQVMEKATRLKETKTVRFRIREDISKSINLFQIDTPFKTYKFFRGDTWKG